ncbi:MAG: hypothetical protein Cons2KO_18180 [Congregibacter sp.]
MKNLIFAILLLALPFSALAQESGISMGNGTQNWILTDGATRDGNTFVIPEVHIDGNGWLVMHPFENGKPNGNVVAGYSKLADGTSQNVAISVEPDTKAGDLFIVMLHRDANHNGEFDFVFVNEREVVDIAVFEGSTMVGHVLQAP